MTTSATLLLEARSGDLAAFEQLLSPLLVPAFKLAFTMLAQREAAEDAVQEAAFRAWTRIRSVRAETDDIRPWFLTIVANQCRSTRRGRWWRIALVGDARHGASSTDRISDHLEEGVERAHDLRQAVERLSTEKRAVLALAFGLDLPLSEVGRILGVSHKAAKSRLHRAVVALRAQLRTEEEFVHTTPEVLPNPPEVLI